MGAIEERILGVGQLELQLDLISSLEAIVGEENVKTAMCDIQRYLANTMSCERVIMGAIKPQSRYQVQKIVKLANLKNMTLHPVSSGKNWGYGTANPVNSNCWILDLSCLKNIINYDAELGYVELEPGVTQQQLFDFLQAKKSKHMVPTTGAGPHCSIIGNALERGYGITPNTDHFSAVTQLEILLPSGEILTSLLSELGGRKVDKLFKWGLGPYLDGLFSQSGFGVILSATIVLAKRSDCINSFFFHTNDESKVPDILIAIKNIKTELGSLCSGINFMNSRRVLSMSSNRELATLDDDGLISNQWIVKELKKRNAGLWNGIGSCYIPKELEGSVKKIIKKHLSKHVDKIIFYNRKKLELGRRVFNFFGGKRLWEEKLSAVEILLKAQKILEGEPSSVALPLVYWLNKSNSIVSEEKMDPALDNCGLIWYSPLVPIQGDDVRVFTEMVERVCRKYQIEPLITMTTISESCFDCTIPILYRKDSPEMTSRAKLCFEELFSEGNRLGYVPYRLNIEKIRNLLPSSSTQKWFKLLKKITDPKAVLSPGKFC